MCTTDTCDPATGCQHTPKDCDDHDACTADSCDEPTGLCVHERMDSCSLGRVVPTGTTCEQYVDHVIDGFGDNPSDDGDFADGGFNYTVKSGKIFNVAAPGAAFYYTTFTAPSDSFTVQVVQDVVGLGGEYELDLTTLQVSEVIGDAPNATCDTLIGNLNFPDATDPVVTLNGYAGKQLVLRWRIDASTVQGETDPEVTYTLTFETVINGSTVVDSDPDGVLMIRTTP